MLDIQDSESHSAWLMKLTDLAEKVGGEELRVVAASCGFSRSTPTRVHQKKHVLLEEYLLSETKKVDTDTFPIFLT